MVVARQHMGEEMSDVDYEIETVYQYCIQAGLSHREIVEKARPLLHPIEKKELMKKLFLLLKISLCCIAVSLACCSEPISRALSSKSRFFMFKLLPFWDWTELYSENCLVHNPYYLDQQILETDCQVCEDVFQLDHLNRSFTEEISQFLQRDIPVIVSDATEEWPAMDDSFTILNITQGYIPINEDVCKLQTNLKVSSHHKVFGKILSPNSLVKWYAHWENCGKASEKFLRKFYSRPYFMPDVVQMTESNWLLMSSGYKGKKFKSINVLPSISVMWVAQIRGYQYIRLDPKGPCDVTCNPLQDTIEEGDIVVFSPTLWDFSYLPGEDAENLAIGAEGFSQFI